MPQCIQMNPSFFLCFLFYNNRTLWRKRVTLFYWLLLLSSKKKAYPGLHSYLIVTASQSDGSSSSETYVKVLYFTFSLLEMCLFAFLQTLWWKSAFLNTLSMSVQDPTILESNPQWSRNLFGGNYEFGDSRKDSMLL